MAEFVSETVLKRDVFSETRKGHLADDPQTPVIRRIVSAAPWWSRPLAWVLARREIAALEAVRGIEGTPQLLATDRDGLVRSLIRSEPYQMPEPNYPRDLDGYGRQPPQADWPGKARIALPGGDGLRVGAFARGTIEVARSEGLVLPVTAIADDGGVSTVQVVKDGVVDTREVKTGLTDAGLIEVTDGLAEGELVVSKAGTFLRSGDKVKPQVVAGAGATGVKG